jgi:hypothetical protein
MKKDLNKDEINFAINETTRKSIYYLGVLPLFMVLTAMAVKAFLFRGSPGESALVAVNLITEAGVLLLIALPLMRLVVASWRLFAAKERLYGILGLLAVALSVTVTLISVYLKH